MGASLTPNEEGCHFPHPITGNAVYAILDACHMIKLVRNLLCDKQCLSFKWEDQSKYAKWLHIKSLYEIQSQCHIKAGNNLSLKHIEYENIMKVR